MSTMYSRAHVMLEQARNALTKVGIDDAYLDTACFETQQAVEFLMKAILLNNGKVYDKSHDVRYLLSLFNEIGFTFGKKDDLDLLADTIDDEVKNVKLRQRLEGEFMTYRSGYMDARIEGRAEGEAIGKILERVSSVRTIMKKLNLSQSAAVDFLEIPEIERPAVLQALQGE